MEQMMFDSIRSFRDNEVHTYLSSIVNESLFQEALTYQFGKEKLADWLEKITNFQSINELQQQLLLPLLKNLLNESVEALTYDGTEALDKNTPYLYISNHRDILMDSFILNYILYSEGFDTIESAIGNNLFVIPWIEHLARLNKSFVVKRNVEGKALYEASLVLSQYIRDTLLSRHQSVWIAQQQGRSKNGDDFTQPSLIKMLLMASNKGEELKLLNQYNFVPVSVSYEFDPCDVYKCWDAFQKSNGKSFDKTDKMRLNEMKEGLIEFKGHVHFSISHPLSFSMSEFNMREAIQHVANAIDAEIHSHYKIFPFHWYCYDKANHSYRYKTEYEGREKDFETRIDHQLQKIEKLFSQTQEEDIMRSYLYDFYANIVKNYLARIKPASCSNL